MAVMTNIGIMPIFSLFQTPISCELLEMKLPGRHFTHCGVKPYLILYSYTEYLDSPLLFAQQEIKKGSCFIEISLFFHAFMASCMLMEPWLLTSMFS